VGNATDLEVVADLLSTDAVRVSPGMPVELDGWGGEEEMPMLARVRLVEPVATTRVSALGVDEQRVNVVLDFVTPCETLGDGYRLTTRFVLWEGERVLSVPSSAVFREGDAWKLFVARDGRARTLAIGRRSEAAVEVRSGVAAGDTVVLFPSDRVVEGMKLQLRH
jgi:HlyD family secretion protein